MLSHICTDMTLVNAETVSVPAGKFPSQHFHSDKHSSDSWIAARIPFSMVKAVGKDYELTLMKHGEGVEVLHHRNPHVHGSSFEWRGRTLIQTHVSGSHVSERYFAAAVLPKLQSATTLRPAGRPPPDLRAATPHAIVLYLRC